MKHFIFLLVLFCGCQCSSTSATTETEAFETIQATSQVQESAEFYADNTPIQVTPAQPRKYRAIYEGADVVFDTGEGLRLTDNGTSITMDGNGMYQFDTSASIRYNPSQLYIGAVSDMLYRGVNKNGVEGYYPITADTIIPKTSWELAVTGRDETLLIAEGYAKTDSCWCYFDHATANLEGKAIMIPITYDVHEAVLATACSPTFKGNSKYVVKSTWGDLFLYVIMDQPMVTGWLLPNTYNFILINNCPECK